MTYEQVSTLYFISDIFTFATKGKGRIALNHEMVSW